MLRIQVSGKNVDFSGIDPDTPLLWVLRDHLALTGTRLSVGLLFSIDKTGLAAILASRSEMGTGIRTTQPLVVADELDADRSRIAIEQAIGDRRLGSQNTDGSRSIRNFHQPMREAGVAAPCRLVCRRGERL